MPTRTNANARGRVLLFVALNALCFTALGLAGLQRPMFAKEAESEKTTAKDETAAGDKAESEKSGSEKAANEKHGGGKPTRASADRAATEELRDIAEHAYEEALIFYESGDAFAEEVHRWSLVWLDHDLQLASDDESKLASTQAHVDRMTNLANAGLWRARELEYYVAESELMLDRLKPNPDFVATIAARRSLEGQWDVVSIEEDGGAAAKPDIKSITIAGRRATFEHRLGTAKALLMLDPANKPGAIDIIGLNEEFPFGGQGIFKVDGNKLTLCWGSGAVRPSGFATKAGDNVILCVLKKTGSE